MKPRTLSITLEKAIKTFPAIVVTGPRQSGKTTLLKMLFSKSHRFVSLEEPDIRIRAKEDPRGFLAQYPAPIILDEIQYVPELLSYIKTLIDENRKPGQWLFTGSQNFVLMQSVSQSLAGRAAILSLLPFTFSEQLNNGLASRDISHWLQGLGAISVQGRQMALSEFILRGCYPEITTRSEIDRELWCSSYISTYLERDVRNLTQIGDLGQFEIFLKLCATRTGQNLNLSEMARDIGISVPTAKRWMSVLETGYQVFLLYPYYRNIGKRLIKSPKLYFTDTALASYLLGIHTEEILLKSPSFGALFETTIINDVVKRFLHFGKTPAISYIRTRDGLEVDLVLEESEHLHLFEIKGAATVTSKHAGSLIKLKRDSALPIASMNIISNSQEGFTLSGGVKNYNWRDVLGH